MKDEPNNVTATLKVVVTGVFYDDDATEETLRYVVEQDLEDAGFEVDVSLLKEQEPIEPSICGTPGGYSSWWYLCGKCKSR